MKNSLQQLRWARNWSQLYLSKRSGVSRTLISTIENHTEINPSVGTSLRLAQALGVKVEDIFSL